MIYISHKKWTLTVFFGAKVDEDVVEEVVCAHVQGPLIIRLSIDLYARVVTVAVQYERKGIVYLSGEYQKIWASWDDRNAIHVCKGEKRNGGTFIFFKHWITPRAELLELLDSSWNEENISKFLLKFEGE